MADVNPGLAAQAENGATVIGVNPNAIVQEEVAPPKVERMNRPGGPKTLADRWQEVVGRVSELPPLRKVLLAVSILLVAVTVVLVAASGDSKDDYKVLFFECERQRRCCDRGSIGANESSTPIYRGWWSYLGPG